ncbi:LOW QUALITY PROTEIN: putative Nitronate monooxygenase/FMN-dependent dehydrogenase/Dihydroorotate dehydrogenase [Leishmania utingensis]|uniref:Nitronate monooxygenase/FMN-dependent dehydrogenase/Dihydroorotate dehydrogenase n=1 Tax=Leishmania utingensis TaxID=653362 RepID=A0AAW3ANK0_9TRYP
MVQWMASAVSNAGGLGLLGAGSMMFDVFQHHVRRFKEATKKPFGVNLSLTHDVSRYIEFLIEEKVPIVFTSAGSPKLWTQKLQSHGIKVAHVVPNCKLALKCEAAGVDAVVAEGFEAGGHNGREEITTMTLIPQVRKVLAPEIPLIAVGGIASGEAMLAAMALGAEGVRVGTRFAVTQESSAAEEFKKRCTAAGEAETWLTLKQYMPTRLLLNDYGKEARRLSESGATKEQLKGGGRRPGRHALRGHSRKLGSRGVQEKMHSSRGGRDVANAETIHADSSPTERLRQGGPPPL